MTTAAEKLLAVVRERSSAGPWDTSVEELCALTGLLERPLFRARQQLSVGHGVSFRSSAGVRGITVTLGHASDTSALTSVTTSAQPRRFGGEGVAERDSSSLLLSRKALNNNNDNKDVSLGQNRARTSDTSAGDLGRLGADRGSEASALAALARTVERLVLENAELRARLEAVSLTKTEGSRPVGASPTQPERAPDGVHGAGPECRGAGLGGEGAVPSSLRAPKAPSAAPGVHREVKPENFLPLNPANTRAPIDSPPGPQPELEETRRRHHALLRAAGVSDAEAESRGVQAFGTYDERVIRASVQELEKKVKSGKAPSDLDGYFRGMLRRAEQPIGPGLAWKDFDGASPHSATVKPRRDEKQDAWDEMLKRAADKKKVKA